MRELKALALMQGHELDSPVCSLAWCRAGESSDDAWPIAAGALNANDRLGGVVIDQPVDQASVPLRAFGEDQRRDLRQTREAFARQLALLPGVLLGRLHGQVRARAERALETNRSR